MKKFWTAQEQQILREYWPQGGIKACMALLPGRTVDALQTEAQKLKLFVQGRAPYRYIQWTDFMDQQIRQAYRNPKTGAIKAMARHLDVPYGALRCRAMKLGCVVRFQCHRWDNLQEEQILLDSAELGLQTIQRRLQAAGFKRSKNAIHTRLLLLDGVQRDPDVWTARQLAKLCGVGCIVIQRWINRGYLKAKRGEALFTRDTPKPEYLWRITRKDFRQFCQTYPGEIDIRKVNQPWFMELAFGYARAEKEKQTG